MQDNPVPERVARHFRGFIPRISRALTGVYRHEPAHVSTQHVEPQLLQAHRSRSICTMDRITVNPRQMGGVPCIRGLRIPVATVLGMLADGMTTEQVITELPPLELDDIAAALRYAADTVSDREIPLQQTA